jgi:hypothetical protein
MPRIFSFTSLTAAGLAAVCIAPAALAQGALKPVEALIVNPPSRPVPVTVLSAPAQPSEGSREAYQVAKQLTLQSQNFNCTQLEVPAGKRLVVEYVGGHGIIAAPGAFIQMSLDVQGVTSVYVPANPPVGLPNGTNHSAGGQLVRAYADAGFSICASATTLAFGQVWVGVVGYLVPKP